MMIYYMHRLTELYSSRFFHQYLYPELF